SPVRRISPWNSWRSSINFRPGPITDSYVLTPSGTHSAAIRASRRSSPRLRLKRRTNNCREPEKLLRRAKAAQRLQSRGRVRGRRLALDSGGVDLLSGFRRAAMGDEDIYYRHHLRLSRCADSFLGVRDDAGRNQTRIRDRVEQIRQAAHRAKDGLRDDLAGCRVGVSVCVSTDAIVII